MIIIILIMTNIIHPNLGCDVSQMVASVPCCPLETAKKVKKNSCGIDLPVWYSDHVFRRVASEWSADAGRVPD